MKTVSLVEFLGRDGRRETPVDPAQQLMEAAASAEIDFVERELARMESAAVEPDSVALDVVQKLERVQAECAAQIEAARAAFGAEAMERAVAAIVAEIRAAEDRFADEIAACLEPFVATRQLRLIVGSLVDLVRTELERDGDGNLRISGRSDVATAVANALARGPECMRATDDEAPWVRVEIGQTIIKADLALWAHDYLTFADEQ